ATSTGPCVMPTEPTIARSVASPTNIPSATRAVYAPGMTPGTLASGATAVFSSVASVGRTDTHGHGRWRPSTPPVGRGFARTLPRASGSAVTIHLPGLMPETRVVTAVGPLPGMTPSMVSSLTNESRVDGFPLTRVR